MINCRREDLNCIWVIVHAVRKVDKFSAARGKVQRNIGRCMYMKGVLSTLVDSVRHSTFDCVEVVPDAQGL